MDRTCTNRDCWPKRVAAPRARARRRVRRLHGRSRRPRARAARSGRDAADRPRSRPGGAAIAAESLAPWRRSRRTRARRLSRDLASVLDARGIDGVDGALADLGVSSMQFDAEGRGFSFRRDEPLDMRMDQTQGPTAADLLARRRRDGARGRDLPIRRGAVLAADRARRSSRRAATAPVDDHRAARGRSCGARSRGAGYQRIDPATRTFQALRIWVNRELEGLDAFLVDGRRGGCAPAPGWR